MDKKHFILGVILLLPVAGSLTFAQPKLFSNASPTSPTTNIITLDDTFTSITPVEAGDIVMMSEAMNVEQDDPEQLTVAKTDIPYHPQALGIITQAGGLFVSPQKIAIRGEVTVKVQATSEQPIRRGDFITTSSLPGIGMKAKQAGYVLGQALESFKPQIPEQKSEEQETNINEQIGTIRIILAPRWLDDSYFSLIEATTQGNKHTAGKTSTGEQLAFGDGTLTLDASGNVLVDGALISTGNITSTGEATLMNLYVTEEFTTPMISAPAFEHVEINLGDTLGATELRITDSRGDKQATITSDGNLQAKDAHFSSINIDRKQDTIGTATLPSGKIAIFVPSTAVTATSVIMLTPKDSTAGETPYLGKQETGKGFWIHLDIPLSKDVTFNYWIIN